MNNTISVYELLGLIKDDKIKEETYIKYYDRIWKNNETIYVCLKNIIYKLGEKAIELNDKVEILEEDKPIIQEIHLEDMYNHSEIKVIDIELQNKLNEIIDYINKKEVGKR